MSRHIRNYLLYLILICVFGQELRIFKTFKFEFVFIYWWKWSVPLFWWRRTDQHTIWHVVLMMLLIFACDVYIFQQIFIRVVTMEICRLCVCVCVWVIGVCFYTKSLFIISQDDQLFHSQLMKYGSKGDYTCLNTTVTWKSVFNDWKKWWIKTFESIQGTCVCIHPIFPAGYNRLMESLHAVCSNSLLISTSVSRAVDWWKMDDNNKVLFWVWNM